ncbi:GroES-like protein [Cystobasidium minutum MCA 4210]|uniref:GroES-like protein n=1 Tax=Cystobasidium minutum MCA 4210 TaxID=1397322 RepID=UPI0034D00BBF|eukprot:jgi/Rhomi1/75239/CE75238_345
MAAINDETSFPQKNACFTLKGIWDFEHVERDVPDVSKLGPNDVIVAPKSTGICGSDMHFVNHGNIGGRYITSPMVPGHESAGLIYAVGSNVKNLKKGDRVAVEPGQACIACDICKSGRYHLCDNVVFASSPPYDGTLASFYTTRADLCYKLADNVSLDEGAAIEPLAVAVHALRAVAQLPPHKNVIVFGAGPVGLMCMTVAKAFSSRRIIGVDVSKPRLDFAKSFAATDIYQSPPMEKDEDRMAYARRVANDMSKQLGIDLISGQESIDYVFDCTGMEVCIAAGIMLTKTSGTFVQVGLGNTFITMPINEMTERELTVKGSQRYGPGDYQLSMDLVAKGKIHLKELITHRYSFKDARLAFEAMKNGAGYDGKAPIKCIITGPEV